MKEQRDSWFERLLDACQGNLRRPLFLDETGANTSMVRTHGRSTQGERCVGLAPGGHGKAMTGVAATMAHAMDGDYCLVYVTEILLPTLGPGDVVVTDDLPAHRLGPVRALIESAGARPRYLPPHSPDLDPIERIGSKVKRLLRSIAARTVDTLHDAFGQAFAAVTLDDIRTYFHHSGYKL